MYMLMIILSIATFFLGTLEVFRVPVRQSIYRVGSYWENHTESHVTDVSPKVRRLLTTSSHPFLQVIELLCLIFFTIEITIRFFVCPWKLRLLKHVLTLTDLVYILPAWGVLFVKITHGLFWHTEDGLTLFIMIEAIKIFRVLRIFRFMRFSRGLRILYLAFKNSVSELRLLLAFVAFNTTIFASFIYCAEAYSPDQFENAFQGMWWALITMTTVGYGDMYPQSLLGYFVGSLCALTGILMIQMPIPIIVSNFHAYYSLRASDEKSDQSQSDTHVNTRPPDDKDGSETTDSDTGSKDNSSDKAVSGEATPSGHASDSNTPRPNTSTTNSYHSSPDLKRISEESPPSDDKSDCDINLPNTTKTRITTVADIVNEVCDTEINV